LRKTSTTDISFTDSHPNRQSGQALLIILLVLAVSLTVVLSTASKSITDVQTSGLEEDSLRAFNAAEVGIEEALIQQTAPVDETFDNNASYSVDVTEASPALNEFVHPAKFLAGDTATFWFASQNDEGVLSCASGLPCLTGNSMTLCWGNSGVAIPQDKIPAVEVSVFYDSAYPAAVASGNYSGVKVGRAAYDPNGARRGLNNFSATGNCNAAGNLLGPTNKSFPYRATFTFDSVGARCRGNRGCLLMARVKFLYNNTAEQAVGIQTSQFGPALPPQGAEIESTGVAGDSTRKINVYQSYGEIPSIFDSAVISKGSLVK